MSHRLLLLPQIQEAYETLIKRRGQPKDAEPQGQDSWNFHDWCVRFRQLLHARTSGVVMDAAFLAPFTD